MMSRYVSTTTSQWTCFDLMLLLTAAAAVVVPTTIMFVITPTYEQVLVS
jgi:hypothetical protein